MVSYLHATLPACFPACYPSPSQHALPQTLRIESPSLPMYSLKNSIRACMPLHSFKACPRLCAFNHRLCPCTASVHVCHCTHLKLALDCVHQMIAFAHVRSQDSSKKSICAKHVCLCTHLLLLLHRFSVLCCHLYPSVQQLSFAASLAAFASSPLITAILSPISCKQSSDKTCTGQDECWERRLQSAGSLPMWGCVVHVAYVW